MINSIPVPYTGLLLVYLQIPFSRSLKDRRHVVRSFIDRVNQRWNISSFDLGPDGSRSEVFLCFTLVDSTSEMAKTRLDSVLSFIYKMEDRNGFSVIQKWVEVDCYDELSFGEN